jgi:hypothetical protein
MKKSAEKFLNNKFSTTKILFKIHSIFKKDTSIESFDPRILITKDSELRDLERTSLNRICDISDWRKPSEI